METNGNNGGSEHGAGGVGDRLLKNHHIPVDRPAYVGKRYVENPSRHSPNGSFPRKYSHDHEPGVA